MKYYDSRKARCPYYKQESRPVVRCQGLSAGHTIHQCFDSNARALEFKKTYCRGKYSECPFYRLIEENET